MAITDGKNPSFLYRNVMEGATLSESSGGAALATGALTDLTDGLTFTAATFSGFSGAAIVIQADSAAAATSETFTTVENPLATNWTDVGDQALQATGGAATDSGMTSLGVGEKRMYTVTAGAQSGVAGYAAAELSFPVIGATGRDAGVMLYDPRDGSYVACFLWNDGTGTTVKEYNGTADTGSGTIGDSFTPTLATDYGHRVTWDGTSIRGYRDEALVATHVATVLPAGFNPTEVGIIQTQSTTGASGTAEWDDFTAGTQLLADTFAMSGQLFQGATGANRNGTYTLKIEYSDDGSSWTEIIPDGWSTTPAIGCDATVYLRWDTSGAHQSYRFTFTDVDLAPSGSVTLATMALGMRMEFDEWMASRFDPDAVSLKWEQNRNMGGQYVGGVVRNARQSVALKFSQAGLANTFFHDPDNEGDTGSRSREPSWGNFLKTCWSLGKPWWFQWRTWDATAGGLHVHEGSFYCYPSSKSRTGAPFISPIRRSLRFAFDVMAEGYVGDMPLNDE